MKLIGTNRSTGLIFSFVDAHRGFGFWLRLKSNILCAFCFSPAWWLWRSVYTRSHLELGRKSLQRQWYFVLRRGRVGRCQACERQKAKTLHHEIQTSNPLTRNGSGFCVLRYRELSLGIMPKLPNAEGAIIELTKLRDYCLSPQHPRGRHKARRFQDFLGLTTSDADWLRQKLLAGVAIQPAEKQETDSFGSRWRVDIPLTRQGKAVVVRTGWIIRTGEQKPRLITCWVL